MNRGQVKIFVLVSVLIIFISIIYYYNKQIRADILDDVSPPVSASVDTQAVRSVDASWNFSGLPGGESSGQMKSAAARSQAAGEQGVHTPAPEKKVEIIYEMPVDNPILMQ